jgi:hypothetical protein
VWINPCLELLTLNHTEPFNRRVVNCLHGIKCWRHYGDAVSLRRLRAKMVLLHGWMATWAGSNPRRKQKANWTAGSSRAKSSNCLILKAQRRKGPGVVYRSSKPVQEVIQGYDRSGR